MFIFLFSCSLLAEEGSSITVTPSKAIDLSMNYYLDGELERARNISTQLIKKYKGEDVLLAKIVLVGIHFDTGQYDQATKLYMNINKNVMEACEKTSAFSGWTDNKVEFYCNIYYSRSGLSFFKLKKYEFVIDMITPRLSLIKKYTLDPLPYYEALFSSYLNTKNYKSAEKYIHLMFKQVEKENKKNSLNGLYYNYACLESRKGNNELALDLLKKVKDKNILLHIYNDKDLAGFRDSKYFNEIKSLMDKENKQNEK